MSREEAIAYGKDYYRDLITACCEIDEKHKEFVRMSLEALSQEPTSEMVHVETLRQVMWERDIAIEQLHELGYELGQKIEPCDDAISREAVDKYIARLLSGYLYDGERERLEIFILTPFNIR